MTPLSSFTTFSALSFEPIKSKTQSLIESGLNLASAVASMDIGKGIDSAMDIASTISNSLSNTENPTLDQVQTSALVSAGSTLIDTQAPISAQALAIPVPRLSPTSSVVSDAKNYTVDEIISKPIFVDNLVWNATQTTGTIIYSENLFDSDAMFPPTVRANNLIRRYKFFRANVKVRIEITATRFHAGRLKAFFSPVRAGDETESHLNTYQRACAYLGTEIDPVEGGVYTIEMPFILNRHYLTIHPRPYQLLTNAKFNICVLSPLVGASTATSSITLALYVVYTDVETHSPCIEGNFTPSIDTTYLSLFNEEVSATSQITNGIRARRSRMQSDLNRAYNLSDSLVNGPHFLNLGHGSENVSTDPILTKEEDMMLFTNIVGRESFLSNYEISTVTPTFSVIGKIRLSPYTEDVREDLEIRSQVTNLSYVANAFTLWRGSIKFRFSLIKNSFTQGRLGVCYIPPGAYEGTVADLHRDCFSIEVDMSSANDFNVVVPYQSDVSTLKVHSKMKFPFDSPPPEGSDYGYLMFYLVNPITIAVGPTSVDLRLYVSGHSDFRFFNPRPLTFHSLWSEGFVPTTRNPTDPNLSPPPEPIKSFLQMSVRTQTVQQFPEDYLILGIKETSNFVNENNLDEFTSINELITRPQMFNYTTIKPNETAYIPVGPFAQSNTAVTDFISTFQFSHRSYLYYFNLMFRYWKGNIRYSLYPVTASSVLFLRIFHNPSPVRTTFFKATIGNANMVAVEGYPSVMSNSQLSGCIAAVSIPYQSNLSMLVTQQDNPPYLGFSAIKEGQSNGSLMIHCYQGTSTLGIFRSADPNFKFSYFTNFPPDDLVQSLITDEVTNLINTEWNHETLEYLKSFGNSLPAYLDRLLESRDGATFPAVDRVGYLVNPAFNKYFTA